MICVKLMENRAEMPKFAKSCWKARSYQDYTAAYCCNLDMFCTVCQGCIFTYFLRNLYVFFTYFEGTRENAENRREIAKKTRTKYVKNT